MKTKEWKERNLLNEWKREKIELMRKKDRENKREKEKEKRKYRKNNKKEEFFKWMRN